MKIKRKVLLPVLIISLCYSCRNEKIRIAEEMTPNTESFDWLIGNWERSNEKENRQTYENWKKVSNNEYHGFGFTLQDTDTIWQEDIKVVRRDTVWNFEVTGKGENHPTIFRITKIEAGKLVSENSENEFPKIISYVRDGNKLQAVISGGEMVIPFEFVPVNP